MSKVGDPVGATVFTDGAELGWTDGLPVGSPGILVGIIDGLLLGPVG